MSTPVEPSVASDEEKRACYAKAEAKLESFDKKYTWASLSDTAKMASMCSVLREQFKSWGFTGFYVVKEEGKMLEIGPYTVGDADILATPLIAFGKGQCGLCAAEKATQIQEDVAVCANYIACDDHTRSEMVVPVLRDGKLLAVLDLDSPIYGNFKEVDKEEAEKLLAKWFA